MAPIILCVQIEARRLDRCVPQIFLDEAHVGAGIRLVRGRGVAQPVHRGAGQRRRARETGVFVPFVQFVAV
jgi:hypothetical protein